MFVKKFRTMREMKAESAPRLAEALLLVTHEGAREILGVDFVVVVRTDLRMKAGVNLVVTEGVLEEDGEMIVRKVVQCAQMRVDFQEVSVSEIPVT
jgi:hypothetical protein